MAFFQLDRAIQLLNILPWFKDMYFETVADAEANEVAHVSRIFYIATLPEGITSHWFTYKEVEGVMTVVPFNADLQEAIENNALDHMSDMAYDNNVLTITKGDGSSMTVTINNVSSPISLKGDDWNANDNTNPTLSDANAVGDAFVVTTAGTQFGQEFNVGDWAVKSDGAGSWLKIDNQQVQSAWSNITNKPFSTFNAAYFEVVAGELTIKESALLQGEPGLKGDDGKSAYQLWLDAGNEGTTEDYLNSISANAKLSGDVSCVGVSSLLGFADGEVFPEGMTFMEFATKLLRRIVHPTYSNPYIRLSGSPTVLEVGTSIATSLTAVFTQNHAGELLNVLFKRGDVLLQTGSTALTHADDDDVTITEATVTYQVVATYAEGPTLLNNMDEEDAVGKVLGGECSHTLSVTGKYRHFALAMETEPATMSSSIVRTENAIGVVYKGSNYALNVSNQKYVAVIVPPGSTLDTLATKKRNSSLMPFDGVEPVNITIAVGSTTATYKLYENIVVSEWQDDTYFDIVFK